MHDHISSLRQPFDLIGCGVRARRRRRIVAGVTADYDASRRSVHAVGGMTSDVSRPDCADFYVPGVPLNLRLIGRIEGDQIGQSGGPARNARAIFASPLVDFAGFEKGISNMRDKFPAAVSVPFG